MTPEPEWTVMQADLGAVSITPRSNGLTYKARFEVAADFASETIDLFRGGAVILEWRPQDGAEWYRLSDGAIFAAGAISPDPDGQGFHFRMSVQFPQSEVMKSIAPLAASLAQNATHGNIRIAPLQGNLFGSQAPS